MNERPPPVHIRRGHRGVGEEGVPVRDIADVIGRHLELPVSAISREEVGVHFGWLAPFIMLDARPSALTRKRLGWQAVHRWLIPDLEEGQWPWATPSR